MASNTSQVLILAATNRPFDLDTAALRRLPLKVLIGMPDFEARRAMIAQSIKDVSTKIKGDS